MLRYVRNFVPLIFVFSFIPSKAQQCNCRDNLKFVVERVKKNYVGYNDKVNASNNKRFEIFTDSLLDEASKAPAYQCLPLIRKWLTFFQDKHLSISYNDNHYTKEKIRNYYAHEERTDWTDSLFNSYLNSRKSSLDNLEGIWKDHTGAYEIGIAKDKKSKNDFIGFIIEADGARWTPQQVKLRITKKGSQYFLKYFRAADHSLGTLSFQKINDTLTLGDGTVTSKWYKNMAVLPKPAVQNLGNDSGPTFKILDDKTGVLQMPSYASLDYVNAVDSILKKNLGETAKHDHLIIDLRNNYGGSVLMYDKIIPYIYTNPIVTEGGSVLATEDNIRDYYSNIPSNVSDSMKKVFERNLSQLKSHLNELYPLYPVDTITFSKVMASPKSVSLIINRNTASAAELFVLQAKQSSKVKLYGANSSGAIDYLEVVRAKLPCDFYSVGYPACKSLRLPNYPLDNVGIKPDIEIPSEVSDWIEFVKADRTKNKK
jgi:C-terminal processing protease CtpA/Prc